MEQGAANGNGSGSGGGGGSGGSSGSGGGSHGGGASKRKSADISNSDMVSSNPDMVSAKRDCCTGAAAAADDSTASAANGPSQGTALFKATAAGDVAGVMAALLEHPGDATCRDPSNRTPLQVAVSMNAPTSVVDALLKAGAAAALDQEEIVALLQQAVATLNVETIKALAHLQQLGATALEVAATCGTAGALTELLELGKMRRQVDTRNVETGETPMLAAVRQDAPDGNIFALLQAGANPHIPDANGTTPLWSAVYLGRKEVVKNVLLCLGDDREFALNGCSGTNPETLLNFAVGNSNNDVSELLLEAKADPTRPGTQHGVQRHPAPLFTAVMNGNAGFVCLVAQTVGCHALKTTIDPVHGGLLHAATACGHVEVVRALLDGGCDVHHKTNVVLSNWTSWATRLQNATALRIACFKGKNPVIELLIGAKANPTVEDLQLAIEEGNLPVLKLLLDAKTDPTVTDRSTGCTPLTALVAAATSSSWHRASGKFDPAALELMLDTITRTEIKRQAKPFKTCTFRMLA
jgi:ankyrin repeat protein